MKHGNAWIQYVALRFGAVDSRGRSALTSALSAAGIAFGVTALIVILSVMNGFQMGYIESILEVSSYHVRVTGDLNDIERVSNIPGVRTVIPFTETQVLVQGNHARQRGALLRTVPADLLERDTSFASFIEIVRGSFSLHTAGSVVLGAELARGLGVSVGDTIMVVAASGSSETELFPDNNILRVTGTVKTGYYEIDSTYAFVSPESAEGFSDPSATIWGVKLNKLHDDARFATLLEKELPDVRTDSWRNFNRSFFGALRVEKTMLLFLVILIFLVVMVNIYHAMRRAVYERREEICVLTALGSTPRAIQKIFIFNGFSVGFTGAFIGLLSGLFLSVHVNNVFHAAECIVNGVNAFISALLQNDYGDSFSLFSPDFFYMQEIPVRIFMGEVLFVFVFGLLSATCAALIASKKITAMKPAEVLRYE